MFWSRDKEVSFFKECLRLIFVGGKIFFKKFWWLFFLMILFNPDVVFFGICLCCVPVILFPILVGRFLFLFAKFGIIFSIVEAANEGIVWRKRNKFLGFLLFIPAGCFLEYFYNFILNNSFLNDYLTNIINYFNKVFYGQSVDLCKDSSIIYVISIFYSLVFRLICLIPSVLIMIFFISMFRSEMQIKNVLLHIKTSFIILRKYLIYIFVISFCVDFIFNKIIFNFDKYMFLIQDRNNSFELRIVALIPDYIRKFYFGVFELIARVPRSFVYTLFSLVHRLTVFSVLNVFYSKNKRNLY
jgi:hypothetical protein